MAHNHSLMSMRTRSVATDDATARLLLVGNPNVGKSALFSALTGTFVTVSNYPGTTVEVAQARMELNGVTHQVVDTPGTTGLMAQSEDELVTERYLLSARAGGEDRVLVVIDARQLSRGVALALSVADLGLPMVVAVNMMDEARAVGFDFDVAALEAALGVPVVETVAVTRQGIARLRDAIGEARPAEAVPLRSGVLEHAIRSLIALLGEDRPGVRGLACLLLMGDLTVRDRLRGELDDEAKRQIMAVLRRTGSHYAADLASVVTADRHAIAQRIVQGVTRRRPDRPGRVADFLGRISMHPLWGWPVLALVLFSMYEFVGVFGAGTVVDFFENTLFGQYVTPGIEAVLRAGLPDGLIENALVSAPGQADVGMGLLIGQYGLVSMGLSYAVAIVLPIVAFFFIAFSLMEDSGYLPRLAVMLNRGFSLIGLNGKAVLPLILGLGCDTMATMTTRVLASPKERTLVIFLLALGIPCSAQLGVIFAIMASLSGAAFLVWLVSILVALLVAGVVGSKVIPGERSDFVMEVPPIRRPMVSNVLYKTASRVEWYLREAVPLFLLGTFILWLMARLDLLGLVQDAFSPVVVGILGLPAETSEAFLVGFLRRDYGAAGLYHVFESAMAGGPASAVVERQIVVSMVTITLFLPCIANFFMIIKEKGMKMALTVVGVVFVSAIAGGGLLRLILEAAGW